MRITKRQLKRIIKEEKLKLLGEGSLQGAEEKLFSALDEYVSILDETLGYDTPTEQLKAEVLNFVDGYFEDSEHAAKQYEKEQLHPSYAAGQGGQPWTKGEPN